MQRILAILTSVVLVLLLIRVGCARGATSPLAEHPNWHLFKLACDIEGRISLDGVSVKTSDLEETFGSAVRRDGGAYLAVWRPPGWPGTEDPMRALSLAYRAGVTLFRATSATFDAVMDAAGNTHPSR